MGYGDRKSERAHFYAASLFSIMGIDGTWRRTA